MLRKTATAALLIALTIAGCVAGLDTLTSCSGPCTDTAIINTGFGDAPFPFDEVKSVSVFVVRVDMTNQFLPEGEPTWVVLALPNRSIDLLKFQNGKTTTLGQAKVDTGSYYFVRLTLDTDRSSITLKNGTVLTGSSNPGIVWGVSGNVNVQVALTEPTLRFALGSQSTLRIHFNVDQSFVLIGSTISSGVRFVPSLTGSVIK